jgi:uncharacterized iron-regulated protein/uncharacterized UPF0146 family protein
MTSIFPGNAEAPYPPDRNPEVGDILHIPTGVFVSQEQMLSAATDTRIVYVGETHDNPASHRLQLQILTAMAARYPGQVSLGMEMFNTEQQPVLDRWSKGELDEKSFLKESAWHRNWRMDFDYYRDLLIFAREQRIPVVGLNATKEMVEAVSETPLDELEPDFRDQLPRMDLADPYQKAMSEAVFADHAAGKQQMDRFHRVQTFWDEIMAENIVSTLSEQGTAHRMVVLAGGNHVRNGFGIPRRVFRRLPVSYTLVGGRELEIPEEKRDRLMNIDVPDFPMPPYDYLVFTEYESLPGKKVKLGVRMKEESGQVVVVDVAPESSAAAAGVKAADILVQIDGAEINEMFDLIFEIRKKREGDEAVLVVEREGNTLELSIVFKPLPETSHKEPPK